MTRPGKFVDSSAQVLKLALNPWIVSERPASRNAIVTVLSAICPAVLLLMKRNGLSGSVQRERSNSIAGGDNGTTCGRLPFMRSGGMRHSRASKSISLQTALIDSESLEHVKTMNRNACAATD